MRSDTISNSPLLMSLGKWYTLLCPPALSPPPAFWPPGHPPADRFRRGRTMHYRCLSLTAAAWLLAAPLLRAAEPDVKGIEFFESKIRPVLVEQCYKCHSAQAGKVKGSLSPDTKAGVLKVGENGPAIVPGNPEKSRLLAALVQNGELKMPPKSKLPDAVINDFRRWIAM